MPGRPTLIRHLSAFPVAADPADVADPTPTPWARPRCGQRMARRWLADHGRRHATPFPEAPLGGG
jgi:hypothetical protein